MSARQSPTMKSLTLSDAREHFAEVLAQVSRGETRIRVEKSGEPVAGIVSAPDLERLTQFEEERAKDFAILDEISEAFKDVPAEEIEREVARALAATRARRRAKRAPQSPRQ